MTREVLALRLVMRIGLSGGRRPKWVAMVASSKSWVSVGTGITPVSITWMHLALVEIDDGLDALDRPRDRG